MPSLNPARVGSGDPSDWFDEAAYDSLIYLRPNGQYASDLAASWGYVGQGEKEFHIVLRSGVRFSDGSDLTAQGVKDSLLYFAKNDGQTAQIVDNLSAIDITGPLSLTLHL